jgi:hypothetical protein
VSEKSKKTCTKVCIESLRVYEKARRVVTKEERKNRN